MTSPARNVTIRPTDYGELSINLDKPFDISDDEELIILRRNDAFPVEIPDPNTAFTPRHKGGVGPISGFTDYTSIEVYRGKVVRGTTGIAGTTSLTDIGNFTGLILDNRILRDSNGDTFRIVSNTSDILTVETDNPASGQYVILQDFPTTNNTGFTGTTTSSAIGSITDSTLNLAPGILINRIIRISGQGFVITNNTTNTITFNDTTNFGSGVSYAVIDEYTNFTSVSTAVLGKFPLIDTDIQENKRFYYTVFTFDTTNPVYTAISRFAKDSGTTQKSSIVVKDVLTETIKSYFPTVFEIFDDTGDLDDVVEVLSFFFNEAHAEIDNFDLTDFTNIDFPVIEHYPFQFGLPTITSHTGIDTFRRIGGSIVDALRLKGTKDGVVKLIRILTTWLIDTGNIDDQISEISWLRFFDLSGAGGDTTLLTLFPKLRNDDIIKTSGTTTSSAAGSITDTSQSFTVDELIGGNLIIAGVVENIVSNTATTISFTTSTDHGTGTNYEITLANGYSYDNATGDITFDLPVDLSLVETTPLPDIFVDGSLNRFDITAVDDTNDKVTISSGLVTADDSGTTTSSGPGFIVDTSKSFTVNEWSGSLIFILDRAHRITSNTSTRIDFASHEDHGTGTSYILDREIQILTDDDPFTIDSGSIFAQRATDTSGIFPRPIPGATLINFTRLREFIITIPNIALNIGESTDLTPSGTPDQFTLTDSFASFDTVIGLAGAVLIPKENNIEEAFTIVSNTATSITFEGTPANQDIEGDYVVLSPLNARRLFLINRFLREFVPFFSRYTFDFTL